MNANENAENELMARMKVSKAVATMAIPSVISSLVTVVYNMAERCGIYGTWRAESEAHETGFYIYHVCVIGRWDSLCTCISGIYAANPEYFWRK